MCALQFPYDQVSFACGIEQILTHEQLGLPEEVMPVPFHRRVRNAIQRRVLGARRWKVRQAETCLASLQSELARHRQVAGAKPMLVYVVPYDVVHLRTGGGKRIAGIAKVLSEQYRVYILSLSPAPRPLSLHSVSPDVWMIAVPSTAGFEQEVDQLKGVCHGAAPLFVFAEQAHQLLEFNAILSQMAPEARMWALSSPFVWPAIESYVHTDSQMLLYDVHDDLAGFLKSGLSCTDQTAILRAERYEKSLLNQASLVAFCTAEDRNTVQDRNGSDVENGVVVPNGVDVEACQWVPPEQARARRQRAGIDRPIAVFTGANYRPNHEAVDVLIRELAPRFPDWLFVVVGMHLVPYRAFGGAEPGENVVFTGPVDESVKEVVLSVAEIALAPMKSGTGSSLKIPDYLAHGKLVLGTPVGLRGFEAFTHLKSIRSSSDISGLLAQVISELDADPESFTADCMKAREQVAATLDWSVATRPILDAMKHRTPEPGI